MERQGLQSPINPRSGKEGKWSRSKFERNRCDCFPEMMKDKNQQKSNVIQIGEIKRTYT